MRKAIIIAHLLGMVILLSACKTKTAAKTEMDSNCMPDMVVVQLRGAVKYKLVEQAFGDKYGLDWFSNLETGESCYYFDPKKISLDALIAFMQDGQYTTAARCITSQEYDNIY